MLTKDQQTSFDAVKLFLSDPMECVIVIRGSGGTGKSYITKHITDYIMDQGNRQVVAVAPTHKARRVLHKMLNNGRFHPIPSVTVASILGKMRDHSYIGTHRYSNGSKQKMDRYDCFILDEVSMVCDKDLGEIINYIYEHDRKLILIGDDCQIPAPSQPLLLDDDICYKPDSIAFSYANVSTLREIVRQAAGSIIITIATYIRDHIYEDNCIEDILAATDVDAKDIIIDSKRLYTEFIKDWETGVDTRIIAYTNAAVRTHNTQIRLALGYTDIIQESEVLVGYNNVGFPVPLIENGTDYYVRTLRHTNNYSICGFGGLVGMIVCLVDVDDDRHVSNNLFFINVHHSANTTFMDELVIRAEKVNGYGSTREDYKKYCQLKNRSVFIENVYKYGDTIMTESNIKEMYPLLFTKTSELIDATSRTKVDSLLTDKVEEKFGDIIDSRLTDNKAFADGEVLADQFMVVEKDIYYGYALTAHKCQGSTYNSVYVDEGDFKKISNKWNYRMQVIEHRHKERNQLRYVAYTRASEKLRVVI